MSPPKFWTVSPPTGEQKQKKRTNHVLPKPDNFIRYRQEKVPTENVDKFVEFHTRQARGERLIQGIASTLARSRPEGSRFARQLSRSDPKSQSRSTL